MYSRGRSEPVPGRPDPVPGRPGRGSKNDVILEVHLACFKLAYFTAVLCREEVSTN